MLKNKKKILFLVQLPPPTHGASIMNQKAYESTLIRSRFECSILPLRFADSVSDIGTFRVRKLALMVLFSFKLVGKLITYRPDAVYFTIAPVGGAFIRDAAFSFLIRCFGVIRVYHLHGKGIRNEADSSFLKKALYRYTFRKGKIILLAKTLTTDIQQVFNGEVFILPNGLPKVTPACQQKSLSIPTFIYLSNLVRSKGIEIFLQSLKELNNRKVDYRAKIIGAPFDMSLEEVKHFIEANNLTGKTEVLGPLYGAEKIRELYASDILVFPTYYGNEAFPLTILEAMQAGIPVIASNNGAIAEIIDDGETGFILPMHDVGGISEKMERLALDRELRKRMGAKGKEKFERLFTIERFEHQLLEIFKKVLN